MPRRSTAVWPASHAEGASPAQPAPLPRGEAGVADGDGVARQSHAEVHRADLLVVLTWRSLPCWRTIRRTPAVILPIRGPANSSGDISRSMRPACRALRRCVGAGRCRGLGIHRRRGWQRARREADLHLAPRRRRDPARARFQRLEVRRGGRSQPARVVQVRGPNRSPVFKCGRICARQYRERRASFILRPIVASGGFRPHREECGDTSRELRTLASASRTDKQALLAVLLALGKHPALTPLEREAFLRRALPITSELGLPAGILAAIGREIAFEHWAQGDRRTPIPAEEYRAVSSLPEIGRSAGATAYLRLFEARAQFFQGNYDAAAAILETLRTSPWQNWTGSSPSLCER